VADLRDRQLGLSLPQFLSLGLVALAVLEAYAFQYDVSDGAHICFLLVGILNVMGIIVGGRTLWEIERRGGRPEALARLYVCVRHICV
jgi:hypothetical protein